MRDYYDDRWHGTAIGPDDFVRVPTAVARVREPLRPRGRAAARVGRAALRRPALDARCRAAATSRRPRSPSCSRATSRRSSPSCASAGAPAPSSAALAAPAAHTATRSCRTSVAAVSDAVSAWAASRNGRARPAAVAPSASALAASTPSRRPPLAISGRSGRGRARLDERVGGRDAPVGERGRDLAGALVAPALDERPVRAARARDVDRGDARVAQQRHVGGVHPEADLLDDAPAAARGARRSAAIPAATPANCGSPSGCTASWIGLRWMVRPSAPSSSTSRSARVGASGQRDLGGAEVAEQQRRAVGAAVGRQQLRVLEQRPARAEHERRARARTPRAPARR